MTPSLPSDEMTAAIANWVNIAVAQLDKARLDLVHSILADPEADLRVVANLKGGFITLDVTKAGRRCELYRERVGASTVYPDDGFGHDGPGARH